MIACNHRLNNEVPTMRHRGINGFKGVKKVDAKRESVMAGFRTYKTFADYLGIKTEEDFSLSAVGVDSRTVKKDELFVALKGERVNGHDFLEQVAAKGVRVAMVSEGYKGLDYGMKLLRVEDPLKSLAALAKKVMEKHPAFVVGVTGSLGKTTSKDFTATLLSKKYSVWKSPHSYNGVIGLPLSILNCEGNEQLMVLEYGIDGPGGLDPLLNIVTPDIAVLTWVDLVHAEFYKNLEEIALTKGKIFVSDKTKIGIVNRDIPFYDEVCLFGKTGKLSYSSRRKEADIYLATEGKEVVINEWGEEKLRMPWTVPGEHNKDNALAAITVALCMGLSWEEIADGLREFTLPPKRFEKVIKEGITYINDAYNASLSSVRAALTELPVPNKGGKKIAVLGEMRELGKYSKACHEQVAEIALGTVDTVLCLGNECQPIYEIWTLNKRDVALFDKRVELVSHLKEIAKPGDVVLLKGANRHELWKVLEEI